MGAHADRQQLALKKMAEGHTSEVYKVGKYVVNVFMSNEFKPWLICKHCGGLRDVKGSQFPRS